MPLFFECITSFNINQMIGILQKSQLQESIEITKFLDDNGNTLLHRAAYENSFRITETLLSFYK